MSEGSSLLGCLDAQSTFQNDIDALYTVFEWSATSIEEQHSTPPSIAQYCRSINQISHWKKFSALSCLRNIHEEQFSRLEAINECSFLNELLSLERHELLLRIDRDYILPNRLK